MSKYVPSGFEHVFVHRCLLPLAEFVRDFVSKKGYKPQRILDMPCYDEAGINAVDHDNTALENPQVLVTLSENFHNVGPMTALIEWRDLPFELRAARSITKGALQLVPLTHSNLAHKTNTERKEGHTCATINDEQYMLSKPAGPMYGGEGVKRFEA